MSDPPVADDETLLMRVPPAEPFFVPPGHISSANFKLDTRIGETGLSVYRKRLVTEDEVLNRPDAIPGSLLVEGTAGEIRKLTNAVGEELELDVVPVDEGGANPGHAEIRGPVPGKLSKSASKALRDLFRRVEKTAD